MGNKKFLSSLAFWYAATWHPTPLHSHASSQCRALCRCVASIIFYSFKNPKGFSFLPHMKFGHFFLSLSLSLSLSFFFSLSLSLSLYLSLPFFSVCRTLTLDRLPWLHGRQSGSTSRAAPPPPKDPHRFISREVERIYHESLFNRLFVLERGLPTSNAFFNFIIQNRGWQTLCAPPVPRVALVVREFHSNLPFKVGTTVFVRGKWVEFGA